MLCFCGIRGRGWGCCLAPLSCRRLVGDGSSASRGWSLENQKEYPRLTRAKMQQKSHDCQNCPYKVVEITERERENGRRFRTPRDREPQSKQWREIWTWNFAPNTAKRNTTSCQNKKCFKLFPQKTYKIGLKCHDQPKLNIFPSPTLRL